MLELILTNNRAFSWQQAGSVWAKGYVFSSEGRQYAGGYLTDYFAGIETEQDFAERVCEANGSFCVVVKTADGYLVAVDRLRSMMMFVAQHEGKIMIGDDANVLKEKLHLGQSDLDELKVEELRQSGYTVGSHTIYKSIAQLRGGEYAKVNENSFALHYYYEHIHGDFLTVGKEEVFKQLDGVTERVFKRLIDSVNGRQIVVPLSGGYDSRYIAAGLKKLGYENVCCFTYGRRDSFEVQISRQVAEKLGYEWHFVEYTNETWQSIFTEKWTPFYEYAGQLSQQPHVQDVYAIKTLLDQGIIHNDAVVVPGHGGDHLSGSFLMKDVECAEISRNGVAKYIYENHFWYMKPSALTPQVILDIEEGQDEDIGSLTDFNNSMEKWLATHRWSKFIVNAVRIYEFLGLEWRIPFWDIEMMGAWYRVPNEHRGKDGWYPEYLLTGLFKEYGIDFVKKKSAIVGNDKVFSVLRYIKNGMKKVMPISQVNTLQQKLFRKKMDCNNTSSIIAELRSMEPRLIGLENIADSQSFNAILVLRYLQVILGVR